MKKNKKNILFLSLWLILTLAFIALLVISSIYFTHYEFDKQSIDYWYKFVCLIFIVTSSSFILIFILLALKFFYEIIAKIKMQKQEGVRNE